MPGEIDPSALSRSESVQNGSATPQSRPMTLANSAQKSAKVTLSAPRVDLEPIYTALKVAIGDHWPTYKDAVSCFLLGTLNLSELASRIDSFIGIDPTREHLHNQLITAIHINVYRDAPDQTVASWVSANDKPTNVTKQLSGDAAEARLKHEIMQLPPRARHRLKGITDEPPHPLRDSIIGPRSAKHPPTSINAASSASASTANANTQASAAASDPTAPQQPTTGLNKDSDIRRRFAQPPISENRDLPHQASAFADRLLSIAFEFGLNGSTQTSAQVCAEFIGLGVESFLKEELGSILTRTRTDAPVSIPIPGADAAPGFDRSRATAVAAQTNGDQTASVPPTSSQAPPPPPPTPPQNKGPVMGLGGSSATGAVFNGLTTYGGGSGGVLTARYKKRLIDEDRKAQRGEIKRSELGLLPVERESLATTPDMAGTRGDLRIGWEMGDTWMSSMLPWVSEKVALHDYGTDSWASESKSSATSATATAASKTNGHFNRNSDAMDGVVLTNGASPTIHRHSSNNVVTINGHSSTAPIQVVYDDGYDPMVVDDNEIGWEGAGRTERDALANLLDGCLAVGR